MNDELYLNTILALEKNMSNDYSIALNEASNDDLYNEWFDMFEDIKDCARNAFNLAYDKGFYQLENAEQSKLCETYNKLKDKQ